MSRVKKSSGKQYQRLSQAADSDDEVTLYSMPSSSSSLPPTHPHTATTEFGSGHYDQSLDLELPEVERPPPRKKRGVNIRVRGQKGNRGFRFERELRACVCLLLVGIVGVGVIVVAVSKFNPFTPDLPKPASPISTSLTSPVATPQSQPPVASPSGGEDDSMDTSKTPPTPEQPTTSEESTTAATSETATPTPDNPTVPAASTSTESSAQPTEATADVTGSSHDKPTTSPPPSKEPPLSPSTSNVSPNTTSIAWEREFFPALTETALQLQDMNRDGVTDVIMVEGLGPCEMILRALDGMTGESVWQAHLQYDSFAVKCDMDLNNDDIIDCISAGRQSGFRALSGVDGSLLWDRDPSMAYLRYNFYFPLTIPDLDGDRVLDLINTHGGDATYSSEDTERSPSFLVAVSGRTGQQLMERVPMPDGRESYMSPVWLSRKEEGLGDVLLVGTGGETLPGSLWAIGMDSLKGRILRYYASQFNHSYEPFREYSNRACSGDISNKELEEMRPVFDPDSFNASRSTADDEHLSLCPAWGSRKPIWNKYGLCVYRMLSTEDKGVILPPILVDMTGDGQEDMVVSTFDGQTLVLDGESGEIVWEKIQRGTESYSVPAPLFYNEDSTPDLLVRVNRGVWNTYNYSYIAILDGQTGDTLWRLYSTQTGMMSVLSLAANQAGADGAVFISIGYMKEDDPAINADVEKFKRAAATSKLRVCLEAGDECWEDGVREATRERRHGDQEFGLLGEGKEEDEEGDVQIDSLGAGAGDVQIDSLGVGAGDVFQQADSLGTDTLGAGGEDSSGVDYDDFMVQAMAYRDPVGLWDGAGDDFPDPHTNFSGFLSYCGSSEEALTASLYVLTRQQIATGHTPPLASHKPLIYFPGTQTPGTQKRHGGSQAHNEEDTDPWNMSPETARSMRCSHITGADMIASSPVIGDFNSDGRLEVAYVIVWGGVDSNMGTNMPARFKVYVATLEDSVSEVFGEEGVQWARKFLPGGQQPWTRYMGTGGDNVYRPPSLTDV